VVRNVGRYPTGATCRFDGCTNPPKARWLCSVHYRRWLRCGDPQGQVGLGIEARFWSKVKKAAGCWEWQGATYPHGHGQILSDGGRKGRLIRAHRYSYELANGPIPEGMLVLHKCDNARCVRPDHLELGDHDKNMRDMSLRGRVRRGSQHPCALLTPAQVREIRRLGTEVGLSQSTIADRFGVTRSSVQKIINRINWRWLA
jgi:DNA-binding CsgD family transcriptional regulator